MQLFTGVLAHQTQDLVNMTDPVARYVQKYNGRLPTERDPRYLEILNMSKYRILAFPDVGNHLKCANCGCGREDGRKYIDFGLQIDWYGPVYLCTECIRDIAEKSGLFRALELKVVQLEEIIKNRTEAKLNLENFKETVLRTFEEVNQSFVKLHPSVDGSTSDTDASVGDDENESSESGVDQTESGTKESESGTTKSSAVPGRKNVPKLADILKLADK
jgi:hypothetical protein